MNLDATEKSHALNNAILRTADLTLASNFIHRINQHFYTDINTGTPLLHVNPAEKICLMHSELSEMLEGVRKNTMDDHLKHRRTEEVEAADLLIRLLDYCGWRGLDLAAATREKLKYNATRFDHTDEARRATNGKKF